MLRPRDSLQAGAAILELFCFWPQQSPDFLPRASLEYKWCPDGVRATQRESRPPLRLLAPSLTGQDIAQVTHRQRVVPARAFIESPGSDQKQVALRFAVGDLVECYVDGRFQRGTVVAHNHRNGIAVSPYQVMLDEGSLVFLTNEVLNQLQARYISRSCRGADHRDRARRISRIGDIDPSSVY